MSNELNNTRAGQTNLNGDSFISEPKTIEEFENNVKFQLINVNGWMSLKDYDCALIKARCLVVALQELVKNLES